jgi:hypothetical protein
VPIDVPLKKKAAQKKTINGDAAAPRRAAAAAPVIEIGHPLGDVEAFVGRFVAYPSEAARVAHVLWIGHTHLICALESTPRIAFLSPEPGSGKTRALEVTEPLVPRPVASVNVTPAYLVRKISDEAGRPTILYDEIDTVFGVRPRDSSEDVRALLNAGHRRGQKVGRCVVVGKRVRTEELEAFCAVALAGIGDLPDTILTRSVVIRMRRRAPNEKVEPFRQREHELQAHPLHKRLEAWAGTVATEAGNARPDMPTGIVDRDADVWEPLLVVADLAGGDWPTRARGAARWLVAESKASTPSLGVRLLEDLRIVFGERDRMPTSGILQALKDLEEAPWGELGREGLTPQGLAKRLKPYGIAPKNLRIAGGVSKGYERTDLTDAWCRYCPALVPAQSATAATAATPPGVLGVAAVAGVADAAATSRVPATPSTGHVAAVAAVADCGGGADTPDGRPMP